MDKWWLFKMAWRDSRNNRAKLFLYMAAIIVGVAAQVAITSFRANMNDAVNSQAKELLGADFIVSKNDSVQTDVLDYLHSISSNDAYSLDFSSMALFPKSGYTRLSQIHAMSGDFPFYGEIETVPENAAHNYQKENSALVEESVLLQFDLQPGDSVKIGDVYYSIIGALRDVPGQPMAASFIGPRIYIPLEGIQKTGLIDRGSRLRHKHYVKLKSGLNEVETLSELKTLAKEHDFRVEDVESRKQDIGQAVVFVADFLNLIGFIALLLGGLGVSSSIYVYIREKFKTISILRCVGVTSKKAMAIFIIQALFMGVIGAVIGALLGTIIQLYLPFLLKDFLPLNIDIALSWMSIFTGIITGIIIAFLFALFPLLVVPKISPLYTLRTANINLNRLLSFKDKTFIIVVVVLFVLFYAQFMLGSLLASVLFTVGLSICILLLALIAVVVTKLARKITPSSLKYEWRQGLANLYRPNNQTTTLLLTFGLGVTLISSLYLTQDVLLETLKFDEYENTPNLALFDIQQDQNDGINSLIEQSGHTVIQNVPIVTMRLQNLNGKSIKEILSDSSHSASRWALNREYRSTYRDYLMDSETIEEGDFVEFFDDLDSYVPISVDIGLMGDLGVQLGDTLTWDVQGFPIKSYISSVRSVKWDVPQPNFFVVFPDGVLNFAPQFYATTLNTGDKKAALDLQRDIVLAYPNISALDIGLILETVKVFTDKVAFVIQFIGLFSVITGLIVLAGSASTGRYQRMRESALLRTLGATRRQVSKIEIIEYTILGIMASFVGIALSIFVGFMVTKFYFDIPFKPNSTIIFIEIVILIALIIIIGLINTRGIRNKSPLEIIRM